MSKLNTPDWYDEDPGDMTTDEISILKDDLESINVLNHSNKTAISKNHSDSISPPTRLKTFNSSQSLVVSPLLSGLLFLLLFFLTLPFLNGFFTLIASIAFCLAFFQLIKFLADILLHKKTSQGFLFVGVLLLLGASIMLFWQMILAPIKVFLLVLFGIFIVVDILFFFLHAYIAYMKRLAFKETRMTAFIMVVTLLIFSLTLLYENILLYLLLSIFVVLFSKASIDFSKRLRVKKS